MKRSTIAIVLGCALALSAWADSKEERARELISLMQMEAQFEQMQVQMQNMFANLSPSAELSDGERAIRENFQSRMWAITQEEMGWPQLEAHMVELYTTYFSEQELVDMIEFHRTPTGQRMIETMPMITEETMLFSQEAMVRLMPRMQALGEELSAELAEHHQRRAREAEDSTQ